MPLNHKVGSVSGMVRVTGENLWLCDLGKTGMGVLAGWLNDHPKERWNWSCVWSSESIETIPAKWHEIVWRETPSSIIHLTFHHCRAPWHSIFSERIDVIRTSKTLTYSRIGCLIKWDYLTQQGIECDSVNKWPCQLLNQTLDMKHIYPQHESFRQ